MNLVIASKEIIGGGFSWGHSISHSLLSTSKLWLAQNGCLPRESEDGGSAKAAKECAGVEQRDPKRIVPSTAPSCSNFPPEFAGFSYVSVLSGV